MLKTDREGALRALILLAKDEEMALGAVRRKRRLFNGCGFVLLLAAFFLAFNPSFRVPGWVLAFVASLGGAVLGMGIWFENSLAQWPVLKEFLDLERLRGMAGNI